MIETSVAAAIESLGGPSAVARKRALRSPWSVSKWIRDGLPAEHVLWLARETDWRWTPHQLAPDLYPHPDDGMPEERRCGIGEQAA